MLISIFKYSDPKEYNTGQLRKLCVNRIKIKDILEAKNRVKKDLRQKGCFYFKKEPKGLLKEYVESQNFTSISEIMEGMKELFRDVLQQVMDGELEAQLGYAKSQRTEKGTGDMVSKNYQNGYSKKKVKTQLGEVDIQIPRDRNGEYSPKIIEKYDVEISAELVSKISDKTLPEATAWQNRPLESVHPFIFMDAIQGKKQILRNPLHSTRNFVLHTFDF